MSRYHELSTRRQFLDKYFERVLAFDPMDVGHKSIIYQRHGPGFTLLPGRATVLSRDEFGELVERCADLGVKLVEDRR